MSKISDLLEGLTPEQRRLVLQRLRQGARPEAEGAGGAPAQSAAESERISARAAGSPAPLSFGQQRLWFLDQLEPGSPAFNLALGVEIEGRVAVRVFAAVLREIVRRHESLRTTFSAGDAAGLEPVQVIAGEAETELPLVDLRGLRETDRDLTVGLLARRHAAAPYELARGPLLRCVLLRAARDRHRLLVGMHHIVTDAWSFGIFVREFAALHAAFASGRPSPLPELPVQYADFSLWQRERLRGERIERELAFWRSHLAGAPSSLELPADRPRPSAQSFRGGAVPVTLPPPLATAVRELGKRRGTTLFMTLLAAFQAFLARLSGETDLVVGTPIAGRNRTETEPLIGFFLNNLALRADLSGDPPFLDLLARVGEGARAAFAHQELPFERLVEELEPERSLARTPLFQTMLVLQNAADDGLELPGLRLRPVGSGLTVAHYDLTLSLAETSEAIEGSLEYSSDLFDVTTAGRLARRLVTLIEGLAAEPARRLSELPLLPAPERHQVLAEWNDTPRSRAVERPAAVHRLVALQAERTPDAVAAAGESEHLSYAELARRASGLARRLRAQGIGRERVVALAADRSPALAAGFLGILEAGAAVLPLDPAYPAERLRFLLEDAQAAALVASSPLPESAVAAELPVLEVDARGSERVDREGWPAAVAAEPMEGGRLAYLVYTSGSTGRPKGALISHAALAIYALEARERFGLAAGDRILQFASPGFDVVVEEILPTWLAGGTVVFRPAERLASPGGFAELLAEGRVTGCELPAAFWHEWVSEMTAAGESPPASLRLLILGCEKPLPERLAEWRRFDVPLIVVFGLTETTITSTLHLAPPRAQTGELPIGRPIADTAVYLLDGGLGSAPAGVPGDLCIGGLGLARGYLGRPALTADRFVPSPLSAEPGARLYRTGDRARWRADGSLEFLGRSDDQLSLRGFRVEPGEVEAALARHPAVRQAAVVGHRDAAGDLSLVGYVVAAAGAEGSLDPEELRRLAASRLPAHMVPAAIVAIDALPLTAHGKVDRRELERRDLARPGERRYVAPRTPTEGVLAAIWEEVLGISPVGVEDGFFALGGHSLSAMQAISRARRAFGVELPLRLLFDRPTVGALALEVEVARRGSQRAMAAPIEPAPRDRPLPLSFAQERLWFLDRLEPGSAVYNMPAALALRGRLAVPLLERVLAELMRRHEALRTTVGSDEQGRPVAVISPPAAGSPLRRIDLRQLPAAAAAAEADRLAGIEAALAFDLVLGPVLRATLLLLGEAEHHLLFTLHHFAGDGWSMGVLVREVTDLYGAYAAGAPPALPPLALQYQDHAAWQRGELTGARLVAELGYWRARLAGAPALTALPLDRPRPAIQSFRGAARGRALAVDPPAVAAAGRRQGVTPFMVLVAVFDVLLARWTGQEDLVVGTPVAGRDRLETEGVIGCFVNTLALRVDLAGDPTVGEAVDRVRATTLDAYAHQDLPFEKLVEELRPRRDLAHSPIFQVMFDLDTTPRAELAAPGIEIRGLAPASVPAKFDLALSMFEADGRLHAAGLYSTALFDPTTIDRLLAHLEVLLGAALADSARRLSELPWLSKAESHQLTHEWSASGEASEAAPGVVEEFAVQVARRPDAIAVVAGGESLSYAALGERVRGLAHALADLGVGPEQRVGLSVRRSPELVVGLLGIFAAGGAYLPIDPAYPPARRAFLLRDAGATALVGEPRAIEEVADLVDPPLPSIPLAPGVRLGGAGGGALAAPAPADLAYLIYTSGTTGQPKAVLVEHSHLANLLAASRREVGWDEDDVMPVLAPASFDIFLFELLGPLLAGGTAWLLELRPAPDPDELAIALARATRLHAVPALMRQVVDLVPSGAATEEAAPRLRTLFVGGDAVPPDLLRALGRAFPRASARVLYGPTETTILCAAQPVAPGEEARAWIGRPLAGARLRLLDAGRRPVPIGTIGEIYIGGGGVTRGYLGRPAETAERFVTLDGERLYRSGDLARHLPDGRLEFIGRADDQVKIRGFRIEPGEIEAALEEHPAVARAVVVVSRDGAEGSGSASRLVACVLLAAGAATGGELVEELRGFLRARLPEHMLPAGYLVVDALPLTAHGKVDRKALAERAAESAPSRPAFAAPRSPLERRLAAVWSDVLRLPGVGIDDNFFELGGDSILSLQVVSRARRDGLVLTPKLLFEHQTIARLAPFVTAVVPAPGTAPATSAPGGRVALTPAQLAFLEAEPPDPHHFNLSLLVEMQGELGTSALSSAPGSAPGSAPTSPGASTLASALAAVGAHHQALRLRFLRDEAGWHARELEAGDGLAGTASLALVELGALPAAWRARALAAAVGAAQASLDLAHGPLLRAVLFGMGARNPARLLLAAHHLVVDGVSWRILLDDLETACRALAAGKPVDLPPVPTRFSDWSAGLEAVAGQPSVRTQLAFWERAGEPMAAAFPEDGPGGPDTVAEEASISLALAEQATARLLREAPRAYRTRIEDLLLAALAGALRRWTGERRLLLALEGHGRDELLGLDASRTVGWLTSVYPLVLELPEGGEPGAAIKAIKEQLRRVPAGGVGYGLLRRSAGDPAIAARLARHAPPQLSFNYLGQLDSTLAAGSPFAPASDPVTGERSRRQPREHLLEVSSAVAGGRLQVTWAYASQRLLPATVRRLAEGYLEEIEALVEHCLLPESRGLTPSDLPLAGLGQAELDRVAAELGRDRLEDLYPLSPLQHGLLFHRLLAPGSEAYCEQLVFELVGRLDAPAFLGAWRAAVARNPVLRTGFLWRGLERPLQAVLRGAELAASEEDWSELAPEARARRLELLVAERRRGFDPEVPPLMRVALLRQDEGRHLFLWTFHHLLFDGWSFGLLFREVLGLYAAIRRGGVPELPPGPPFRAYVAWLAQRDEAEAERFWRAYLAGFVEPASLPADRPPEPGRELRADDYRERHLRLPAVATEALRAVALRRQVTLNTLVQAGWALLLGRWIAAREVVFGAVFSGRPAELPGVESMLGLFINTLPVRVATTDHLPLGAWVRRLQGELLELTDHAHVPLSQVQAWSETPRDRPLFDTLLVFENYPLDDSLAGAAEGLAIREVRGIELADYPLTAIAVPGAELALRVSYDARRFDTTTVERLLRQWGALLLQMPGEELRPLGHLSPLSPAERHQLLVEWSDTVAVPPGEPLCLHQAVAAWAEAAPDAVALAMGDRRWSYRELDRRANRLAHRLLRRGARLETVVAIALARGPERIAAVLAVHKAGAAYLPLDPALPQERLRFLLADAGAALLVTDSNLAGSWAEPPVPVVLCADDASPAPTDDLDPGGGADPERTAYVLYTSGSTGRPKGVAVPHRGLLNVAREQRRAFGVTPGSRVLQFASLSFDASIAEIALALSAGACLAMPPEEEALPGRPLLRLLERERIEVVTLPPSSLAALPLAPLPALRTVTVAGEVCPPDLPARWRRGRRFLNLYGPTEATVWTSGEELEEGAPGVPGIGRPIAGVEVLLLDPGLRLVPVGAEGEIVIGGKGVARGYVGRPALTAERFVPHPAGDTPGARVYRSGDLARRRPDGRLLFLGRSDQQVKLRGFRIEPGEIEAALRLHPAIAEAAVVLRVDRAGEPRLVAYLVPPPGVTPVAAELRELLAGKLPAYLVPAAFVTTAELPRGVTGKVDRRALAGPAWAPAAAAGRELIEAPRTPLEEMLAETWREVLGSGRVGVHEDFFALGGHSLLATRLQSRLLSTLELDVPLRLLFDHTTIAAQAEAIGALHSAAGAASAPPIERREADLPAPLSFAQRRLWVLDQLAPGSAAYDLLTAASLAGELDLAALDRSLARVIHRHEALRTTFELAGEEPVQVVRPAPPWPLVVVDLSGLGGPARQREAEELGSRLARFRFDLATGPLVVAALLRLDRRRHALCLGLHHIVADGWSLGILTREVEVLYRAEREGRSADLPEPPVQYADFAEWQRGWLAGETLERQMGYWRVRLGGEPVVLDLPTDRPRPAVRGDRGSACVAGWPGTLGGALRRLARSEGATLFMALVAGFQALLGRFAGQDEVRVGVPIAGRNRPETEGLIGFFVNTLVLRSDLAAARSFRSLVGAVRETALGAYAHQDVPFERLVDELDPERSLQHTPLFQAMLVFQNLPAARLDLPGLTVEPLATAHATARFDLTLMVEERDDALDLELEHSSDLFDRTTAERWLSHLRHLLEAAAERPDGDLRRLPLLSAGERQQVEREWNDTRTSDPGATDLAALLAAQATATPDRVALVFEEELLSYAELDARAGSLARHLRSLGVGVDVPVGVCLERGPDLLVALLAVLAAGGAYVPLDPSYPGDRLAFMARDARLAVLLTADRLTARLPAGVGRIVRLDRDLANLPTASGAASAPPAPDQRLAYVIYTSGSTGQPKGAMNSHRAIANRLLWMQEAYALGDTDRVLQKTPVSFDVSVWELFWPLITGACLVLARPEGHRDGAYLLHLIAERRVTILHFVPSMLQLFLEEEGLRAACRGLRQVIASGEALSGELAARHAAAMDAPLDNLYGPTEAAVDVTAWRCRPGERRAPVPIGRPIANLRIHLLDRRGEPVPIGVAGELHIGGAGLGRGYLARPALTAERFVPDPTGGEAGARLYRSGDRARRLPDGCVDFLGRLDFQVKVRGLRIELGEIESALAQAPGVTQAAVTVWEPAPGDRRLVAYVVTPEGRQADPEELRSFLAGHLPEPMLPALYVPLAALPLNPSGKVDRRALPAPTPAERPPGSVALGARSAAEGLLLRIWSEVLRVGELGLEDNFFSVGGDSILAIQVVNRARRQGIALTVQQIFLHPTVGRLAAVAGATTGGVAEQGPVVGPLPLTPIQSWFLDRGLTAPEHFNQALMLELRRPFTLRVIELAVAALVRHHDALRLRFERQEGVWRQVAAPPGGAVPWACLDFSALAEGARRGALEAAAGRAQRSLSLGRGPLLRAVSFRLGSGESDRLLLAVHHLAVDGVSWRILLEDLDLACTQLSRGQAPALPLKTSSYREWAEGLVRLARGTELAAEAGYWLDERRAGAAPLPADWSGGVVLRGASHTLTVELSREETEHLLRQVLATYQARVDEVLLAALATVVCGWSGQEAILVDVEGHGREPLLEGVDPSRTVGWFTALYPVSLGSRGPARAGEHLREVQAVLRAVPRGGVGYGLLRYLRADDTSARLGELPRAEVLFTYLGRLDQAVEEGSPFALAVEQTGEVMSPDGERSHVFEIDAAITGGRLVVNWTCSQTRHQSATAAALAEGLMTAVRDLLMDCAAGVANGVERTDLSFAGLDPDDLEAALEEVQFDT